MQNQSVHISGPGSVVNEENSTLRAEYDSGPNAAFRLVARLPDMGCSPHSELRWAWYGNR